MNSRFPCQADLNSELFLYGTMMKQLYNYYFCGRNTEIYLVLLFLSNDIWNKEILHEYNIRVICALVNIRPFGYQNVLCMYNQINTENNIIKKLSIVHTRCKPLPSHFNWNWFHRTRMALELKVTSFWVWPQILFTW